jgi:hypothetical protein
MFDKVSIWGELVAQAKACGYISYPGSQAPAWEPAFPAKLLLGAVLI